MSEATSYSDYYLELMLNLKGCSETLVLAAMRRAGRAFCERTEAFREELPPIPVVDYQRDYDLDNHGYDANIHRLRWVNINSCPIDLRSVELRHDLTLRFASPDIPHDRDDRMLTCGAAGNTDASTWPADASVGITLADTAHDITGLDITAASDMYDAALIIQTGLRTAMENNLGYVEWNANDSRFHVWADQCDVSYLTAGSTGTDISGVNYMNGLTGTGTLSAHLRAEVALMPHINTDILPHWFLERYGSVIVAGAAAYLCKQPRRPWTDPLFAAEKEREYNVGLNAALIENDRGSKETMKGPRP